MSSPKSKIPETENHGIQPSPGTPENESLNSSLFSIFFEYADPGDAFDGGGNAALANVIEASFKPPVRTRCG